jgi:hypothetical protein
LPTNKEPILTLTALNGSPTLSAIGLPGQTYQVLASQDLVTWTLISTITLDGTGSGQFIDPAGTSLPRCFYRMQNVAVPTPTLQIQALAGGPIVLSWIGQPGRTYYVLSSQDLVTWTPIGGMTLDVTGLGQFSDPASATLPFNFYRLQAQ